MGKNKPRWDDTVVAVRSPHGTRMEAPYLVIRHLVENNGWELVR